MLDWFRAPASRSLTWQRSGAEGQDQASSRGKSLLVERLRFLNYPSQLLWSVGLALACSVATPVSAAERLTLRLGPFEQSVAVTDLEKFAKTGEYPSGLKPYAPLLTPEVREILNRRLHIDPQLGDKVFKDLLRSSAGKQILEQLGEALPESSVEQLQTALRLAVRQANGLTVIGFLQAYPAESVTIDASAAVGLALQFNAPYWQSQALGPLLERELMVAGKPFRASFNPAEAGPYRVRQQTLTLQDWDRRRQILTDIYWSRRSEPGPLVVISHGFGADRTFLAYLARHLASHGITVAALDHPGSNVTQLYSWSLSSDPSDLFPASEFIERPRDISFLLDQLAKLNEKPGSLQGKLNTERVSVIGHSLGGYTVLAVAGAELHLDELQQFCKQRNVLGKAGADWLQCAAAELPNRKVKLRDERVAQVIALNPVVGRIFGKTGMTKLTVPTLILSGTDDSLTPALSHQLGPFDQVRGPKYLVTAIGATHLSISNFAPGSPGEILAQKTLVNERTGKVADPLRQLLQGVTVAFVKQLTPAASTYRPFLSAGYAQSLSTPEMPLRLNTKLPPSVISWLEFAELPKSAAQAVKLPSLKMQISASAFTQDWLFPRLVNTGQQLLAWCQGKKS